MKKQVKRCGHCRRIKATHLFSGNRSTWDGLQRYCIKCQRDIMREYQQKHKAENLQRNIAWRKENPARFALAQKKWWANVSPVQKRLKKEKSKIYYWKNRERILETKRKLYAETHNASSKDDMLRMSDIHK